jgi:hypothetical protein
VACPYSSAGASAGSGGMVDSYPGVADSEFLVVPPLAPADVDVDAELASGDVSASQVALGALGALDQTRAAVACQLESLDHGVGSDSLPAAGWSGGNVR